MELVDTHCHLTFEQLAEQIEPVLDRSASAGVTSCITIGTDIEHSRRAIELARRQDGVYATVGIHPHDARLVTGGMMRDLETLARELPVVAIGETGLDFHYSFSPRKDQTRVFAEHLDLARRLRLPVIVHCREAFDDTIDILDRCGEGLDRVVFHCFGGSADQAKEVLNRGYHISFTGVVTFKNAHKAREAATVTPLDKLMIETDCPFMSPEPLRKQKVNEPALLVHTARFLAGLKNVSEEAFAATVTKTSRDFFDLPGPASRQRFPE